MSNNEMIKSETGFMSLKDFNMSKAMSEELIGLDIRFEKIKIPSSGSTIFEVPGANPNEPDAVKEFSAVILYHHPLYAFYKTKYTGGNNPPDCGSFDGITGKGVPGGKCSKCLNNQFGTGENESKACKNRRRVYVLREGDIFPLLLSIPTSSLTPFTRYLISIMSINKKLNNVVTRFKLIKATNAGNIEYSQAQFLMGRDLTVDESALINTLSENVKAFCNKTDYDDENIEPDYKIDPATGEVIEPLV